MSSSPTFLKLITSADIWGLHSEWPELQEKSFKLKTGVKKHTDLGLVFEEFSEDSLISDAEMDEEQHEPPVITRRADRTIQKKLDADSKILNLYFFGGVRPSMICTILKVDKRYVYKVVEQTKKALLRLTEKRDRAGQNRKISNLILTEIKKF